MPSDVETYQNSIIESLRRIFGTDNVKKEWDVAKDSQDDFTRELYCPRLDIAVGPFNIDGNVKENILRMSHIVDARRDFINGMLTLSETQNIDFETFLKKKNPNPRCFLAIEIEKSGSRKHMLGNIINASIIGAVGIVVPFDDKALKAYRRIDNYITFAVTVKKTRNLFQNVLIIKNQKFISYLKDNSIHPCRKWQG